jgi:hypothetical protein
MPPAAQIRVNCTPSIPVLCFRAIPGNQLCYFFGEKFIQYEYTLVDIDYSVVNVKQRLKDTLA